jgi:hypothetical protein
MKNTISLCLGILLTSTSISMAEVKVPEHKFGEPNYEFGREDYKKNFFRFAFKRGFEHCTYPKGDCDTSKICDPKATKKVGITRKTVKLMEWCKSKCGHKIDMDKVYKKYCTSGIGLGTPLPEFPSEKPRPQPTKPSIPSKPPIPTKPSMPSDDDMTDQRRQEIGKQHAATIEQAKESIEEVIANQRRLNQEVMTDKRSQEIGRQTAKTMEEAKKDIAQVIANQRARIQDPMTPEKRAEIAQQNAQTITEAQQDIEAVRANQKRLIQEDMTDRRRQEIAQQNAETIAKAKESIEQVLANQRARIQR